MSNRVPNILTVMDDPKTFAPFFAGPSWDVWRAYLAATHALPMTATMHEAFRTCAGRQRPPSRRVRRRVNVTGRRGGKDSIESFETAYDAAFTDYRPYLARRGEFAHLVQLAADRKQAGGLFTRIEAYFDNIPMLRKLVTARQKDALELGDRRVIISVMTASHRTTRGITAARVTANECAFWRDESSANPDVEIIRALEPAMATIPSATLTLMSTPYGRNGLLWKWYDQFYGEERDDVLVWRAPSWVTNPTLDRGIIDAAYQEDPIAAAAEFGAEFRTDLQAFVSAEVVDACVAHGCYERGPISDVAYRAFCDPSGGSSDSMVLAIAHHDRSSNLTVLDCIREVKPPFNPTVVCTEFAAVMKSYGLSSCVGDKYGGTWPASKFAEVGVRYDASAQPKSEIYLSILALLNSGRVELLDNKRLRAQLLSLERRVSRTGRDSISEPPRSHDDVVNGACGALLLAHTEQSVLVDLSINSGFWKRSEWRTYQ